MATERKCDLCGEPLTDRHAHYDLAGRYEFRLVKARKLSWWRGRRETRDLDICAGCVNELGRAAYDDVAAEREGS